MDIKLVQTGKTHFEFANAGFEIYKQRLKHYCNLNYLELILPSKLKSDNIDIIKKNEAEMILKHIKPGDFVVLLDDKGVEYSSHELARKLQKWMEQHFCIVFVIGGAYGFDNAVYKRAHEQLSLSKLTFTHQMVKLIFSEQLYRCFTIIKGIPYHHQ